MDQLSPPVLRPHLLVTNQPNPIFLRNWNQALEVPRERHVDTFRECGNLFGVGIPVKSKMDESSRAMSS